MSTNQQEAPSVEETLNKTDFGQIINENKKAIMIISGLVIAGILLYSILDQVNSNKRKDQLDKLFNIEKTVFTSYIDGKSDANTFKAAFAGISNEYHAEPILVSSMLKAINKLDDEKSLDDQTIEKVRAWMNKMDKKNDLYLFTSMRMAAVYEDKGNIDGAIGLMEELLANKVQILTDKIHLDLGRFYKSKNNTDKAREHFNAVINMEDKDQYKSIAQIYLSEL